LEGYCRFVSDMGLEGSSKEERRKMEEGNWGGNGPNNRLKSTTEADNKVNVGP